MDQQQKIELLATKVMGWHKSPYGLCWYNDDNIYVASSCSIGYWNPYKSIADAWMLWQQLRKNHTLVLKDEGTDEIELLYMERYKPLKKGDIIASSIIRDTIQEAICDVAIETLRDE